MSLATVSGLIIAVCIALLGGMAALIKSMLLGKLDEIQKTVTGIVREQTRHGERITRLEEWRKYQEGA